MHAERTTLVFTLTDATPLELVAFALVTQGSPLRVQPWAFKTQTRWDFHGAYPFAFQITFLLSDTLVYLEVSFGTLYNTNVPELPVIGFTIRSVKTPLKY